MIKFKCRNIGFICRRALLLSLILKRIRFTFAAEGSSSSTQILHDTDSTNAEFWTGVDQAIDKFIVAYESQNEVTLTTVDRQLKPTKEFEAGLGLLCGTFRLEFSFRRQNHDSNDREKQSSVIVKVPELAGFRYVFGQKMFFYEKEQFMYEKVFPLMYQLWPNEKLAPQLHLVTEKSRIFFLENIHENGFRTTGKVLLNSPEMCRQVIESLAQFHALSTVLLKDDDGLYRDLVTRTNTSGDIRIDPETSIAFMRKFEKYVKPSLTPRMIGQIVFMYKNLQSILLSGFQPSPNGFDVILHGDPNRSNVFFPRSERPIGAPAGCKFVDFYFSRPGSPVIDLINYLLTSVQFDVFKTNRATLFRSYIHEFDKTVPKGYRKYDMLQLFLDLRTYRSYFFYRLIFAVPAYWKDGEAVTMDNDEDIYDQVFSSDRYISFFKNWMEYLMDV